MMTLDVITKKALECLYFCADNPKYFKLDEWQKIYAEVTRIYGSGLNIHGQDYTKFMVFKYQNVLDRLNNLYIVRTNIFNKKQV